MSKQTCLWARVETRPREAEHAAWSWSGARRRRSTGGGARVAFQSSGSVAVRGAMIPRARLVQLAVVGGITFAASPARAEAPASDPSVDEGGEVDGEVGDAVGGEVGGELPEARSGEAVGAGGEAAGGVVETSGEVSVESDAVDAEILENGLRARLGSELDGWRVRVLDTPDPGADAELTVAVELRAPDGRAQRRALPSSPGDPSARARELAASLALIIRQTELQSTDPGPEAAPPETAPPAKPEASGWLHGRGWVGLGPAFSVGAPSDPAGGVQLRGGAWFVSDHLQPRAGVTWTTSQQGSVSLHSVRAGVGLAAGGSIERARGGAIWIGASALPQIARVIAQDARRAAIWSTSTELGLLVQYVGGRALVGAHVGVELNAPSVVAYGNQDNIEWGTARFIFGLTIGLVMPRRVRERDVQSTRSSATTQ